MVLAAVATTNQSSLGAVTASPKASEHPEAEKNMKQKYEEEDEEEEDVEEELKIVKEAPLEGGWGWVVVFGVFVVYWLVPGMIRSYGALYLEVLEAFPDSSAATAGWIPALLSSISIGLAPISAVLGKLYTCRNVVFVGGCFCSIGLISSYFATSIFYLFISFGLITGIGAGLCTTPSVIVINSYFDKKRALASGICQSGAAIGSFTLPIFVKILVNEFSLRGAFLIMGGIILNVCAVSLLFTKNGKWYSKPKKSVAAPPAPIVNGKQPVEMVNLKPEVPSTNGSVTRLQTKPRASSLIRSTHNINDPLLKEALLRSSKLHLYPPNERTESFTLISGAPGMPRSASFAVQPSSLSTTPAYMGDREVRQMSSSFSHSIHDIATASVFVAHPASILSSRVSSKLSVYEDEQKTVVTVEEVKTTIWDHMAEFMKLCCDFSLFKETTYLVTVISASFIAGGFPHVLFFVPAFATSLGMTRESSNMLVSICSIVDLVGRIIYGWFMDLRLIRRSHGLALAAFVCAVGTLCIPLSTSYPMLAVFTALYGFGSGSAFMLLPVLLADNHGVDRLPSTYGLMRLFQGSVMLLIPPLAGLLFDQTGIYHYCFLMMGSFFMTAALIMFALPLAQKKDRRKQLAIQSTA